MKLSRDKLIWVIIALLVPALITLAYLAGTEFPQRAGGLAAPPLRARGTEGTDVLAALAAEFVGVFVLGHAIRMRRTAVFVLFALIYFLLQWWVIAEVTFAWERRFTSFEERLFDALPRSRSAG